jgi:hypothetical protein
MSSLSKISAALVLTAAAATVLPAHSAATPHSFVPVRVQRNSLLEPAERDRALRELGEGSTPQHLVILIHGWDTPYYRSTEQYDEVAERVHQSFEGVGESVKVIGFQWASSTGPAREWIPQAFGHYFLSLIGFKNAVRDPYTSKVPRARATGRMALRDLIFNLKKQFPTTRIHLFAHSMGAEVSAHALDPGFTRPKKGEAPAPTIRPDDPLGLDIVALAGADLDYDVNSERMPDPEESEFRPRLFWITIPKIGDRRDKVLMIRKAARHKRALGDSVPHFRGDQLDTLISQRKLVYDTIEIPENHALVDYFGKSRIDRLAAAAAQLRDPASNKSPLLTKMTAVLRAPASVDALAPYLLGDETSPKVYALWRLEQLLCGNTNHVTGDYAEKVLIETIKDGYWWDKERETTPCKVVKAGLWPPSDVVARAKARVDLQLAEKRRKEYRHPSLEFYSDTALGR